MFVLLKYGVPVEQKARTHYVSHAPTSLCSSPCAVAARYVDHGYIYIYDEYTYVCPFLDLIV